MNGIEGIQMHMHDDLLGPSEIVQSRKRNVEHNLFTFPRRLECRY